MPSKVKALVAGIAATGALSLVSAVLLGYEGFLMHGPLIFLAFAGAVALTWTKPLLFLHRDETEALILDEAFLVVMALLLSPLEGMGALALGMAVGLALRRRAWIKGIFNVGQTLTAAGLAFGVIYLLADPLAAIDARLIAAVVTGAAVFFMVQTTAVSAVIALAEGRSFRASLFDGLGLRTAVWAGNVSAGLLAGLVGRTFPWALVIALIPVGVLQLAFTGHLRARQDRKRMDGLFHAALKAHGSIGVEEVKDAIAEAAKDLLHCNHARFDADPPRPDELGAVISSDDGQRWLIVGERRGVEPFDKAERKLLEAIVAIASEALDNATLYRQAADERRKLADVVGYSSDGIFTVDAQGRVTSWNPAMEAITGHSAKEIVGTKHFGALRPRDTEGHDVFIEKWLRGEAPPTDIQVLRPDGETRWLNCSHSALPDGGFVIVARDITAQHEIEELKSDFLATVSHELRTPLTPIKGFIETLLRDDERFSAERRKEFYEIIQRQSERLEKLVEELLEATTRGSGPLVDVRAVDYGETIREGLATFEHQEPNRPFSLEVQDGLPSVLADPQRADQILSNLLQNALKYSPPGSPIRITVEQRGSEALTTVADSGPGIPERHRERIFDRFYRMGDHLTREISGVGLGLHIARRIVENMNGTLWVDDSPEGGAAFTFSLPLASSEHRSGEDTEAASEIGKEPTDPRF